MKTAITELFGIRYPIIAGGMVWCSGWRLAAAVSEAGGLGLIGAGSMHPEVLEQHIHKAQAALGDTPFGVNIPLFYPELEAIVKIVEQSGVKIVFTSGGNPALLTSRLKAQGIKVVHVIANTKFALKAEAAGVDAIVAEGFEAGGHNGRDEITTMALVPQIRRAVGIPVIAAGGVATGAGMLAAMALGADGVQIGSRFAVSAESSASEEFKRLCTTLSDGDTMLCMKKLTPVRLIKNEFYNRIAAAEAEGASPEKLKEILGSRRSKIGIFEGDLVEGELEIGQIASIMKSVDSADEIVRSIIAEYAESLDRLNVIGR